MRRTFDGGAEEEASCVNGGLENHIEGLHGLGDVVVGPLYVMLTCKVETESRQ